MLINTVNPIQKRALIELVFDEMPDYYEIVNGTPKLTVMFQFSESYKQSEGRNVARRGIEPLLPE